MAPLLNAGTYFVILTCVVLTLTGLSMNYLRRRQRKLQDAALAPRTRRSRECQLAYYSRFCECYGFNCFPCTPEQARLYATFLSHYMAPSSGANYLSALWASARSQGFPSHALDYRLHQTLRGIKCWDTQRERTDTH